MRTNYSSRTKILIILNLALVAGLLYLLSIFLAYPGFQQTRLVDPLAEIHALPLTYYFSIAIIALLGIMCLIWRVGDRRIHVLLLSMLAIMLWLTPHILSGFIRMLDAPWHIGVAVQTPQVLSGEPVAFSDYALSYPGSYIYHYSVLNITGLHPLTYIQIYPVLSLLLFVFLCYVLLTRLFDSRVALLASLLAIPGLHYIQIHTSPHSIGALLMLTALLLLIKPGIGAKIGAAVTMLAVVVCHPTTPLLLAIFLAAAWLAAVIFSRKISRAQVVLAGGIVILLSCWLPLYFSYQQDGASSPFVTRSQTSSTTSSASSTDLVQGMIDELFPSDFNTSEEYLSGTPFIYPDIYTLNRGIYFLYLLSAVSAIFYIMIKDYLANRNIRDWFSKLAGIAQNEALIVSTIPLLLFLMLLLAEHAHDLIETSLTYIILAACVIVASVSVRFRWLENARGLALLTTGLLVLTLSFPVVAYSIDAFTSMPRSEEAGLKYVSNNISLESKTVTGSSLGQLGLYSTALMDKTRFINLKDLKEEPDIALFRKSYYYYRAMRFELSFTDNSYTRSLAAIESAGYDKIYFTPAFSIYTRNSR